MRRLVRTSGSISRVESNRLRDLRLHIAGYHLEKGNSMCLLHLCGRANLSRRVTAGKWIMGPRFIPSSVVSDISLPGACNHRPREGKTQPGQDRDILARGATTRFALLLGLEQNGLLLGLSMPVQR